MISVGADLWTDYGTRKWLVMEGVAHDAPEELGCAAAVAAGVPLALGLVRPEAGNTATEQQPEY
jgi:hypothetical protein